MKKYLILLVAFAMTACSMSDSSKNDVASMKTDDLEFAIDSHIDGDEFHVQEQEIALEDTAQNVHQEVAMNMPDEPTYNDFVAGGTVEAPAMIVADQNAHETTVDMGTSDIYHVQKGDTLMMVAFKIYGDYRKWKEIQAWNPQVTKIHEGMELKYYVPERSFGWEPTGLPYLIKGGDTLQTISMDKYGTTRRWMQLYNHNKPLIKNPDLIFAGFTIYYNPQRDLASEVK